MKYAIITLNHKFIRESNKTIFRRIIIEYKNKRNDAEEVFYEGVRTIWKDPYFSDPDASISYKFNDQTEQIFASRIEKGQEITVCKAYRAYNDKYIAGGFYTWMPEYLEDTVEADNDETAILYYFAKGKI